MDCQFSPFQIVYGQNPTIPGISEVTTGGMENLPTHSLAREIISRKLDMEKLYREHEMDVRLMAAQKDRLRVPDNHTFEVGDRVIFYDSLEGGRKEGRILGTDGPNFRILFKNRERKCARRDLLPALSYSMLEEGEEVEEDQEDIPALLPLHRDGPKRKKEPEILPPSDMEVERNTKNPIDVTEGLIHLPYSSSVDSDRVTRSGKKQISQREEKEMVKEEEIPSRGKFIEWTDSEGKKKSGKITHRARGGKSVTVLIGNLNLCKIEPGGQ